MQRPQALGRIVLMCLTASSVSAAAATKKNAETPPTEAQQQAEEAAKKADDLMQQAQRAQLEAQKRAQEAQAQQAQQAQQEEVKEEKKSSGPGPSLNIPVRYYVYSAILGGLGYATGYFSAGPERDLRNPSKHPTQDKTLSLYRKARYSGIVSKSFYGMSGAMGGLAAYKTQSAVREYFTAKARMAALQKEADQRLAQARSPEERKAAEVANTLLVPPEPVGSGLLVMLPEPPPLQAGFIVGPSGDAAVSLSMSF